ncbi:MAG: hypothetical protein CM15mP33_03220 [Candidatus Neomarinimicrobiota bacterium]|nr:MAG: hypothetical protein CM15mP33_03220 [Candidatus Neomarinimicrobiota bacterium]
MDDHESYSWKPWAMVPLRMVMMMELFVVSWSYDESVQKNGSKAASHYIDVLRFNDEDVKVNFQGCGAMPRRDAENSEYGLPEGGKFIGRDPENEWSGRPCFFK